MSVPKYDLTVSTDPETRLVTGTCTCTWQSAPYGLRATVRRAHDVHLESVGLSDPALHEATVNQLLRDSTFGKKEKR